MELYFLGTGAGMPTKERNVTSIALRMFDERGSFWLFDVGEATQHQILHSTLKPSKLEKIFITHLHGDHIFGLPGLLSSRSHQGGIDPLHIYGPKGLEEYIACSLALSQSHLNYPVHVHEVTPGIVFEDDHCYVEAALLDHRIECYGYRLSEKPKPGKLNVDALRSLGVPPGPLYGQLKQGHNITLEDGTLILATDVIEPPRPGHIVTILGDTKPCEGASLLAEHADVLVHEATFMAGSEDLADAYYHSTSQQAAETAAEAHAGLLVLTHFSARYLDELPLVEEANRIFSNTIAAKQHQLIMIQKKESEQHGSIRT